MDIRPRARALQHYFIVFQSNSRGAYMRPALAHNRSKTRVKGTAVCNCDVWSHASIRYDQCGECT